MERRRVFWTLLTLLTLFIISSCTNWIWDGHHPLMGINDYMIIYTTWQKSPIVRHTTLRCIWLWLGATLVTLIWGALYDHMVTTRPGVAVRSRAMGDEHLAPRVLRVLGLGWKVSKSRAGDLRSITQQCFLEACKTQSCVWSCILLSSGVAIPFGGKIHTPVDRTSKGPGLRGFFSFSKGNGKTIFFEMHAFWACNVQATVNETNQTRHQVFRGHCYPQPKLRPCYSPGVLVDPHCDEAKDAGQEHYRGDWRCRWIRGEQKQSVTYEVYHQVDVLNDSQVHPWLRDLRVSGWPGLRELGSWVEGRKRWDMCSCDHRM